MSLKLKRIYKGELYTIGKLYYNDLYICDTIEDKDRGLTQSMPQYQILNTKVKNKTAIPYGKYKVTCKIVSPRFSKKSYYNSYCKGLLPRLLDVPGFDGILIHIGNTAEDSAGCILVGLNKVKGKVVDSKKCFEKLYQLIKDDNNLFIEIV